MNQYYWWWKDGNITIAMLPRWGMIHVIGHALNAGRYGTNIRSRKTLIPTPKLPEGEVWTA